MHAPGARAYEQGKPARVSDGDGADLEHVKPVVKYCLPINSIMPRPGADLKRNEANPPKSLCPRFLGP